MERRLEKQARNEGFVREVNERLEKLDRAAESEGWPPADGLFDFHCECGREEPVCTERIRMTIDEYEAVRAQDDRFAVADGHADEGLERVVERNERFAVVDKVPAAEPFVRDDPRGATSR